MFKLFCDACGKEIKEFENYWDFNLDRKNLIGLDTCNFRDPDYISFDYHLCKDCCGLVYRYVQSIKAKAGD